MHYPEPLSKLIDSFMKLPGIGPKTAARLAFHVLAMKEDTVLGFAKALVDVKRHIHYCTICGHITDTDPCYICKDERRDRTTICVVQDPKDVIAMERMKEYNGLYTCCTGPSRRWKASDRKILKSPSCSRDCRMRRSKR
ncbi:Recombination protein RecR [Geobacillus sp. BCO2]|nr:Recombination protein RecR [Geobacillus sp. BCO2]